MNSLSATLWSSELKLAGWKLCAVRYFFFFPFLRGKKKGWEVVNTLTPPKTFTKATGVFFQRERAMVGITITCRPVRPEEIKSPAPGEGRCGERKPPDPATPLPAGRVGV